jgi:hypothetical protein
MSAVAASLPMDDDPDPRVRASGSTPAEEEAHAAAENLDAEIPEPSTHTEGEAVSPRFRRMRFNWGDPEEMQTVRMANQAVEALVVREFADAYQILAEIQGIVRTQRTTPGGDLMIENGQPAWEKTALGKIIEDYSKMTRKQLESFLGQITTRLFAWEQSGEKMWMEAMFARAAYEERYAISYDALRGTATRTTVDDRNQHAAINAADERYFAIYMTSASRRSQAVVRSMTLLGLRLKDLLQS